MHSNAAGNQANKLYDIEGETTNSRSIPACYCQNTAITSYRHGSSTRICCLESSHLCLTLLLGSDNALQVTICSCPHIRWEYIPRYQMVGGYSPGALVESIEAESHDCRICVSQSAFSLQPRFSRSSLGSLWARISFTFDQPPFSSITASDHCPDWDDRENTQILPSS